jgi:hypothetical protein
LKKLELFGFVFFGLLVGIIAFVLLAISPPSSPESANRLFSDVAGQVEVSLVNTERVLIGDETLIFVSVKDADFQSDVHQIDSDGKLVDSDHYVMFVSDDRQWIRACKASVDSKRGRLVWVSSVELWGDLDIEDNGTIVRGMWVVAEPPAGEAAYEYPLRCDAYINYRANVLIGRGELFSTRDQRESLLFAFKQADDREDVIEGKPIRWELMSVTSSD